MTQMNPEQLASLANELVAAAAEKQLTVRVLGGVAVYMTCPTLETHGKLQRTVKDLDMVTRRADFDAVAQVFAAHGVAAGSQEPDRRIYYREGVEIDLSATDFRQNHRIDLTYRMALTVPAIPLADLLLVKLQRKKFEEKDIQDSIALLLDRRVGQGQVEDQIDSAYIAKLCARDWGLFSTVYENTVHLEKVMDRYIEPEEAQLAWRRIEQIQGEMDRQPKSLSWMVNQVLRRPTQVPA